MGSPLPEHEAERLLALHRYRILDTAPEDAFDRITRLANRVFDVPIALVTLVDANRQWFKSCYGLDFSETDREVSFCAHAIAQPDVLVIPDARADARFADNPNVTGDPFVRFYAGAQLRTPSGHALGTVCIIDAEPRSGLDDRQLAILRDLAAIAMDEIELRLAAMDVRDTSLAQVEAKAAAEAANRAKSEFLSRMSHELRTPLTSILGFAQLLEYAPLERDDRDAVASILRAGNHLLELINEVLDLSRIEAGKLRLSLESVPVADVMRECADLLRQQALAAHVAFEREPPTGCDLHVRADKQRLKQVVLNLLSNAIKYTPAGGRVAFECERRPNGRLRLAVRDSGRGISDASREKLFHPFERLGAEASSVEGTGLGLALSKQLVEAMDGRIDVERSEGGGSLAWVELAEAGSGSTAEAAAVATSTPQVQHVVRPDGGTSAPAGGAPRPFTVLYVEDNHPNVTLVDRILSHRTDLTLLTAPNAALGLRLALERTPNLVLLDLHLPDLNGDELLRLLREHPRTASIPIVLLSADASPGQVERLLAAGADAYLTKPFDVALVRATVDRHLR